MRRREVLVSAAATAMAQARPALAQGDRAHTLRYIPQSDVNGVDPMSTTSYGVRNHGHMCWDTLYGPDSNFVPRPQLCEGHVVEDDGLRWVFTLREGVLFHDGEPVRAEDAVASIKRWAARDSLGQSLAARMTDITALSDRRFEIRLRTRFGPMLEALGKPSSYPCFIYPKRFAEVDPSRPFTEVVGSGPYQFVANERLAGARAVYSRFASYRPAPAAPDLLGGAKLAHFERVEFQIIPDASTAAAALQVGEVDWWEQIAPDLRPIISARRDLVVERVDLGGLFAVLRLNHLQPPFDNPAIRRALLPGIKQADFMMAIMGQDRRYWRDGVGAFPALSPFVNDEGLEVLSGNAEAARTALRDAGYDGRRVTVLQPADIVNNNILASVSADTLQRCGMNVSIANSDWGTLLQRRSNRQPPDQGGWNAFVVAFGGPDIVDPGQNPLLRGNGTSAWFGWPTSPALEALREGWLNGAFAGEENVALGRRIQRQFWQDVPFIPLGEYYLDSAWRRNIVGIQKGIALPLNVRRV